MADTTGARTAPEKPRDPVPYNHLGLIEPALVKYGEPEDLQLAIERARALLHRMDLEDEYIGLITKLRRTWEARMERDREERAANEG